MRSCTEQPFTVYACAGRGQIRLRNFSERRKAALICVPVTLHQWLFCYKLLDIVFSVFVVLVPNVFHTNDMFANDYNVVCTRAHFRKNRWKKRQKNSSDLWSVNWCISTIYKYTRAVKKNLNFEYSLNLK